MSESFYQIRVALPIDAESYVYRKYADEVLLESVQAGEFCFIFNTRQMGKSSLGIRLRGILKKKGYLTSAIDLDFIGTDLKNASEGAGNVGSCEIWYKSIAYKIFSDFKLSGEFDALWNEDSSLSIIVRFDDFIRKIILGQTSKKILLTIDEIDSVLGLDFSTDDFFAYIRSCYNRRSDDTSYKRLNFVLFGVATPEDLISDRNRTPFNLGETAIKLDAFTFEEAQVLKKGFQEKVEDADAVLKEILNWSGGQPFLTHKVCKLVAQEDISIKSGEEAVFIQSLVDSKIITNWKTQDYPIHLRTIEGRLLGQDQLNKIRKRSVNYFKLLQIYGRIYSDGNILADDSSPEQGELKL
jgi:hypothetical protein